MHALITSQDPTRLDVWIESHGTQCAAWFYPASSSEERPPLVVMGHGLGGTREMRLDAYARKFAAAGISALVFDYRGFGDSEGSPRQIVDVRQQLADWHAALAYARRELPVDLTRIAVWGTSFGGGHVMRVGAEDRSLAAVVSQCPFTDGPASLLRRFLAFPPSAAALFIAAIVDAIGGRFGRRPLLMPMAGAPWMPSFLASRDSLGGALDLVEPGSRLSARSSRWVQRIPSLRRRVGRNVEVGDASVPPDSDSLWGVIVAPSGALVTNAIAARLSLTLGLYRPGRSLRRTGTTPVLICACDNDAVAPVGPTVRAARGLPNVQLIRYPYGHFEIYLGAAFERASADQVAFLQRVLVPQPADARSAV